MSSSRFEIQLHVINAGISGVVLLPDLKTMRFGTRSLVGGEAKAVSKRYFMLFCFFFGRSVLEAVNSMIGSDLE